MRVQAITLDFGRKTFPLIRACTSSCKLTQVQKKVVGRNPDAGHGEGSEHPFGTYRRAVVTGHASCGAVSESSSPRFEPGFLG